MLWNYLKIGCRNLLKNKGFSVINIAGLAIGMASAILIFLWIYDETTYEQFHEKKDRIYEAWNLAHFSGELHAWNTTPKVLASAVQKDLPEVEKTTRAAWQKRIQFAIGEKKINATGQQVDSTFLSIFSFPLLKGDPATALMDPLGVVITENLAKSLFGSTDVLGKTVRIDNRKEKMVTGVAANPPVNSRFQFEYLLPWADLRADNDDDAYWGNNSVRTYVLLKQNASPESANAKMKVLKPRYDKDDPHWQMFLYPMSRWRLYSSFESGKEAGGIIVYVRIFATVAVLILLIACINFMNLSTARSEKRAKEVGIRKVAGALRGHLVAQFLGESILIAFMAGILALLIVILTLPGFNRLAEKSMHLPFGEPRLWLLLLGIILITGLTAGSYPAFYLSAFRPVSVLKGTFRKINTLITPRKLLVVTQFSIAIMLILSTVVIRKQLQYAQSRQVGYDKGGLTYMFMTGDMDRNYLLIREELLQSGAASAVTKTSSPLTQNWSDTWGIYWDGKSPDDKTDFDRFSADENFATTAGLILVMGRDFDLKKYPTDSTAMLLNESALKTMGFKDPLGRIVKDGDREYHVVGVFKDFILGSPYYPTKPMVVEGASGWFSVIHVKLNNKNNVAANLEKMEAICKKYNPQFPFEYQFVDEDYGRKFANEQRIATLSAYFAALTIFISCLGLFGLAAYMTATRVKEIGVRKVLGASVISITSLLTKDFLKLVGISFVIGAPVAWYCMHHWLQSYPYRTTIGWWLFVLTGVLTAAIAICTVGYSAVKAALANPVKSLRSE
ncbi:MAG: ABC transporter permease [Flavihumibacter sp.]